MLQKTRAQVKRNDGKTKWMYFLFKDGALLKKDNDIWIKVSNSTKKNLTTISCTIKVI